MKNFVYVVLVGLMWIISCTKENKPVVGSGNRVEIFTHDVTTIGADSAQVAGEVKSDGGESILERGICWATKAEPTTADSAIKVSGGIGSFIVRIKQLAPNRQYYLRAFATNRNGTVYGEQKDFKTLSSTATVTTSAVSSVTQNTAVVSGSVVNDGGITVTQRGFCWNTQPSPTTTNSILTSGNGVGNFSGSMTGLVTGTTYYVRAYATNSRGTSYGNQLTFSTVAATLASLTTLSPSSITATTANSGGTISSDGGSVITERGVCWSISTSPTIANSRTNNGSGTGSYSSLIGSLNPNTTYFVRAYATNTAGTAYGNQYSFTTQSQLPTVTTNGIASVTVTSAQGGGNVIADGGSFVIQRGICWSSTSSSPTIANNTTSSGTGIGSFSSSINGLIANTTYYVRAYATNSLGTAYGNVVTFTTLPNLTVGQSYQGGIIAYIFVSGDAGYISGQTHGLIATTANQSTGSQWGCSGTSMSGTSTSLGTGLSNTNAIITSCTTTSSAASICNSLVSGGYSDWYLPSRDELNKLYLNQYPIGGFSSSSYWSSSQSGSTSAWSLNFSNGTSSSATSKSSALYVRAVRTF